MFFSTCCMGQILSQLWPATPVDEASPWTQIERVALLLSFTQNLNVIFKKLSDHLGVPVVQVYASTTPAQIVQSYRVLSTESSPLIALWICLPSNLLYPNAAMHAVGAVFDLRTDQHFTFFDPNGIADTDFKAKSFIEALMKKAVFPGIKRAQAQGFIQKCATKAKFNVKPYVSSQQGIQSQQYQAFRAHNVDFFGMCSFMTTQMLYRWIMADGRASISELTETISQNWVYHMIDFARVMYFEALAPFSSSYQESWQKHTQSLPKNKMEQMFQSPYPASANSVQATDTSRKRCHTTNNNITSPRTKKKK